jgi:hypothetical protein
MNVNVNEETTPVTTLATDMIVPALASMAEVSHKPS